MTKREKEALRILRRYVTLERAALEPPPRAIERGYNRGFRRDLEPTHRPLVDPEDFARRNPDLAESEAWTNDVAETLAIYTQSWILPIIDALIGTDDRNADLSYLAQITGMAPTMPEWRAAYRERNAR